MCVFFLGSKLRLAEQARRFDIYEQRKQQKSCRVYDHHRVQGTVIGILTKALPRNAESYCIVKVVRRTFVKKVNAHALNISKSERQQLDTGVYILL